MPRNQEPMADEGIEARCAEMEDQREEIQEYLESEGVDVSAWDGAKARADGGE